MQRLRKFYLDDNFLQELPVTINQMKGLRLLSLKHNRLTHLPADLSNLRGLRYLYLAGNPLPEAELQRLRKLLPNTAISF
jgi:Leucine-rich repeat (LRR) protein